MNLSIPRISGEPLQVRLRAGDRLFVVGPNGSGKSALIQHLVSGNQGSNVRRISAHRQTWLASGSLNLTPLARKQFEEQSTSREKRNDSRWIDSYPHERQSAVLFDLIAKENSRARSITRLVDSNEPKKATKLAAESVSAFTQINELLFLGTLSTSLENSNDEEILAKHQGSSASYSIAQMSDGERNAAIIGATVLTIEAGTVLLIDEPERHLHRSIIVPFLGALFARREDCIFIISTHELALPAANPAAWVLISRSCEWENNTAKAWNIETLEPDSELPEELRLAILGSRRKVLFIEGAGTSLDLPIYHALFPDISVVARGSSADVQRAVEGIRGSNSLHDVEAYGLIDRDGRGPEEVDELFKSGVFALDVHSVESIYFCSGALDAVADWQAKTLGKDAEPMKESALDAAFAALGEDGLPERMAARRCEHLLRNRVFSQVPDWKTIRDAPSPDWHISVKSPFPEELSRYRQLLDSKDLDQLVSRYPLRESKVFGAIADALEFKRKDLYAQVLVARIQSEADLAQKLRQRIGPLSLVLTGEDNHPNDNGE